MGNFNDFVETIDETNSNEVSNRIRRDLRDAIVEPLGSLNFGRSFGLGIDSLENEPATYEKGLIYKSFIVIAIQEYNDLVSDRFQVAVTQDDIDVNTLENGGMEIIIRYFETFSLSQNITPSILSLTI